MLDFSQKSKQSAISLLYRRVIMVVLLIAAILLGHTVWVLKGKHAEAVAGKQEAFAALSDLQERNVDVQTKIADLKTDRGVETELREQYGLAKAGEKEIIIVNEHPSPPPPLPSFPSLKWFEKILGF